LAIYLELNVSKNPQIRNLEWGYVVSPLDHFQVWRQGLKDSLRTDHFTPSEEYRSSDPAKANLSESMVTEAH